MPKFTANIDKKFTVWQNLQIKFEAENLTEAKKLLKKWDGIPEDRNVDYLNTETLFNTEESMTKEDNGNQPVFEIKDVEEL